MIRRIVIWVAVVLVVMIFLPAFSPLLGETMLRLPVGWWAYLKRVLPEVAFNWSGIGMVALCSVLIVAALHRLGGWIYSHTGNDAAGPVASRRWSWRWTLAIFAGFWLMFALVIGAAGLGREVRWLAGSQQPLWIPREPGFMLLKGDVLDMAIAINDAETNLAAVLASFRETQGQKPSFRANAWERNHILFYELAGHRVAAVIIPRDPKTARWDGFYVVGEGDFPESNSITNLPAVLARLEAEQANVAPKTK
jgi:hypothetical protein